MATVGRLKGGDLMIAGEINERLPAVTNGLVAHFPFDGTAKGISNRNLIDYSKWVIGSSGSQTGFGANGDGNSIILGDDPFGISTAIWQTLGNDATSDADGGWDGSRFNIDSAKTYRFSVWIQRKVLGDGNYYFGCNGFNSSNTNIGVLNRSDGTTNTTNPYFRAATGGEIQGDWFLLVGHVWAVGSGAGAVHPNTGLYKRDGTKIATPIDFIWNTGTTQSNHRTYLYYSTLATTQQLWCHPRVDVIDGSEPTLGDLLTGINNGGCVVNPITNSNTTISDECIAVDEGTTNIDTSPANLAGYTWGWTTTSIVDFQGSRCLRIDVDCPGGQTGWTGSYQGLNFTGAIGDWCTRSCEYYLVPGGQIQGSYPRITREGNWEGGWGGIYYDQAKAGTWQKLSMSGKLTATDGWMYFYFFGKSANDATPIKYTVYFRNPQAEKKSFPTAFTTGTRGTSQLSIFNPVKTGNYTISFKCRIRTTVGTVQGYSSIFSCGTYYTNNSWTIMDTNGTTVGGSMGFIRKGNAAEWAWGPTNLTTSSDLGKWITLTVVRDDTNYRCYSNGVLKGTMTHASATMQDLIWIGSRETGQYSDSTEFKDLSIYNRALTDDEVKKLAYGTFSIKSNGDIYSNIIEVPNGLPNDMKHFPMGSDALDIDHVIVPSTQVNLAFDRGSAWIGKATTNILSPIVSLFSAWSGLTGSSSYFNAHNKEQGVHLITLTSGGVEWYNTGGQKVASASTVYTVSAYVKFNAEPSVNLFYLRQYRADGSQISEGGLFSLTRTVDVGGGWKRAYGTFTTAADCTKFLIQGYEYAANRDIWIYGVQCEQKGYYTPYVAGTRGYTDIQYNNFGTYTNDWQEFSFIMWVNYKEAGRYRLSGAWSKWYFGTDPSNRTVFSWIDTGSQKLINGASVIPINTWTMIGISVKNNTFIDIYVNGVRDNHYTTAFNLNAAASNLELNSLVGATDYPLDAYVKDLIVSPRAFTVDEMAQIYKTQMRGRNNDTLQVQGQIIEGVTL